ncbi:hypothetical protein HPB52_009948 [Rhipicephalus sanguineus]|uniref:Uncharacterized protein n=1 Tax=Rhipicephalus sanguineus TaxID=34632 RepID=A0A9D4YMV3_RHISA|nr:hypothetical protein HPB52_009948 [Rhipicephalus sanguineus]
MEHSSVRPERFFRYPLPTWEGRLTASLTATKHRELAVRATEFTHEFTAADRRRLWGELSDALKSEGPVTK